MDQPNMVYECWVDGNWINAGQQIPVVDPATEEIFAELTVADQRIVDAAIDSAEKAGRRWRRLSAHERSQVLHSVAYKLAERSNGLAELLSREVGKPILAAQAEVENAVSLIHYFAEEVLRLNGRLPLLNYPREKVMIVREPIGVVGAITPFNYPLSTLICKAAPALGVGCSVVAKPDEHTSLTTLKMAQWAAEAGLPRGVFNVVTGPGEYTGKLLVAHKTPRLIAFTGSTSVGKEIQQVCSRRVCKTILELGGHCPAIVCDDAPWREILPQLVKQCFKNSGQYCYRVSRIYVAESLFETFLHAFVEETRKLRLGIPGDVNTDLGPLNNKDLLCRVESQVEALLEGGAELILGGPQKAPMQRGYYFVPTVLAGGDAILNQERFHDEIFGPVAIVNAFASIEEAIDKANATPYGLAAYLFTENLGDALEWADDLEVGCVWINRIHQAYPEAPFGGIKESGLGREKSRFGIEEFTELKTIYYCY